MKIFKSLSLTWTLQFLLKIKKLMNMLYQTETPLTKSEKHWATKTDKKEGVKGFRLLD